MGADDSCALIYAHALEVLMKVSRRGFLSGAAAAGLASGAGTASAPQTDIFDTPTTVEHRNGMPYRAFGTTGDNVSILGIGGYHIGVPEEADGVRLIRIAIDAGVSFMDNAWEYHDGENKNFEPLPVSERNALLARVKPLAGAGVLEHFKSTQRYDSGYHQKQHGFQ